MLLDFKSKNTYLLVKKLGLNAQQLLVENLENGSKEEIGGYSEHRYQAIWPDRGINIVF